MRGRDGLRRHSASIRRRRPVTFVRGQETKAANRQDRMVALATLDGNVVADAGRRNAEEATALIEHGE